MKKTLLSTLLVLTAYLPSIACGTGGIRNPTITATNNATGAFTVNVAFARPAANGNTNCYQKILVYLVEKGTCIAPGAVGTVTDLAPGGVDYAYLLGTSVGCTASLRIDQGTDRTESVVIADASICPGKQYDIFVSMRQGTGVACPAGSTAGTVPSVTTSGYFVPALTGAQAIYAGTSPLATGGAPYTFNANLAVNRYNTGCTDVPAFTTQTSASTNGAGNNATAVLQTAPSIQVKCGAPITGTYNYDGFCSLLTWNMFQARSEYPTGTIITPLSQSDEVSNPTAGSLGSGDGTNVTLTPTTACVDGNYDVVLKGASCISNPPQTQDKILRQPIVIVRPNATFNKPLDNYCNAGCSPTMIKPGNSYAIAANAAAGTTSQTDADVPTQAGVWSGATFCAKTDIAGCNANDVVTLDYCATGPGAHTISYAITNTACPTCATSATQPVVIYGPIVQATLTDLTGCSPHTPTVNNLPTLRTPDNAAWGGTGTLEWRLNTATGAIADPAVPIVNNGCAPITRTYVPVFKTGCATCDVVGATYTVTVYPNPAGFTVSETPGACSGTAQILCGGAAVAGPVTATSTPGACPSPGGPGPAATSSANYTVNAGAACAVVLPYVATATGCPQGCPLSVVLTKFTGKAYDAYNELSWTTSGEINNYFFDVERSKDGINFEPIGRENGNGTITQTKAYSFKDTKPAAGMNIYRLRQVDFDGKYEYSNSVSLFSKISKFGLSEVRPNPTKGELNISLFALNSSNVSIKITDVSGKLVYQKNQAMTQGVNILSYDASLLANGVYTIEAIEAKTGAKSTIKFVKE